MIRSSETFWPRERPWVRCLPTLLLLPHVSIFMSKTSAICCLVQSIPGDTESCEGSLGCWHWFRHVLQLFSHFCDSRSEMAEEVVIGSWGHRRLSVSAIGAIVDCCYRLLVFRIQHLECWQLFRPMLQLAFCDSRNKMTEVVVIRVLVSS